MLIPNVELDGKSILVTGAAGFIGANLVMELFRTTDAKAAAADRETILELVKEVFG